MIDPCERSRKQTRHRGSQIQNSQGGIGNYQNGKHQHRCFKSRYIHM